MNQERLRRHSARVTSGFFPHFHFLVFFRCPPQHPPAAFINTAGSAETGCQKLFVFRRRDFTQQLLGPTAHYLVPFVTEARKATFAAVPLISDSTCCRFFFSSALFCFLAHRSVLQGRGGPVYVTSTQTGRSNYQLHRLTEKDYARVAFKQIACLLTNSIICGAQETHISRAKWMFLAKQQRRLIYLKLFAVVCLPPHRHPPSSSF